MEFTKALSQHSNILHSRVMKQQERELDLLRFMFCFPTADNAMLPYKSFKYCTIQVNLRG